MKSHTDFFFKLQRYPFIGTSMTRTCTNILNTTKQKGTGGLNY